MGTRSTTRLDPEDLKICQIGADRLGMKKTTRLDVVLRLRDETEKASRATLGKAIGNVDTAVRVLKDAHEQAARTPGEGACNAWLHDIFDHAHGAARVRVKAAEVALTKANAEKDVAHAHHGAARTAHRVIDRVVAEKRAEMRRLDEKREQAALDELAVLRA